VLVVEVPDVESTCQAPAHTFHEAHLYDFNRHTLVGLAEKSGLAAIETRNSPDGGNLIAFFKPMPVAPGAARDDWTLPGNHDRIAGVIDAHRRSGHTLSAKAAGRLASRMARMGREWILTRRAMTGRQRLDALYAPLLDPTPDATPARGVPTWGYILVAYVVAVALEWALLDASLTDWSSEQALVAYLGLQTVAVGVVVGLTSLPSTMRQVARLLAWAVPLFALPAYC
jgi:hypothetical protein